MDKLDLDARVARLERRVAMLLLLIPAALVGLAVVAIFSLRSRSDDSTSGTITSTAVLNLEDHSAANLASQLNDLTDLERRSLISSSQLEAKKSQLLKQPIQVGDLKTDLEVFADLHRRNIITTSEYELLKEMGLGLKP